MTTYSDKDSTTTNDYAHNSSSTGVHPPALWTPSEALLSKFGIVNVINGTVLAFVINLGAMYGAVGNKDLVGVFFTPPTPNPYTLQLWSDWLVVVTSTWGGLGLLAIPSFWLQLKRPDIPIAVKLSGAPRPIDSAYVSGPHAHWLTRLALISYMPTGWKHFVTRTVILCFVYSLWYYGISLLIVWGMCHSNAGFASGSSYPNCYINPVPFIWIKTAWATVFTFIIFPVAIVSGLSLENLPASSIAGWEAKQGGSVPGSGDKLDAEMAAIPAYAHSPTSTSNTDNAVEKYV